MAAESLREASSAAPGATVEGAAVGAGTQHAAALHHFFEQLLSKLLFDESPVELVEPSADALCDLQPIFLPSPCIFQAPFWTHRQPPNLWVYRLALVLADEGSFSTLVSQLLTRCPDESCATRLQVSILFRETAIPCLKTDDFDKCCFLYQCRRTLAY